MPKKYDKHTRFRLTALDKEILSSTEHNIDLWKAGYFGGQVFPWQQYFYHAPQKDKMAVAGIRSGKSEIVSDGFLHKAQRHEGALFANVSISSEQAKIVYHKCLRKCQHPNFSHWVEYVTSSPYPMIRLVNKSELWFRSIGYDAELLRGFEFDWINVDEAGYVLRKGAIDALKGRLLGINPYTNSMRMGLMTYTTSPKGQGSWLYERWKLGDPDFPIADPRRFLSLRATIWDNPLLSREEVERTMAEYTDAMIQQEFYGLFLANPSAVFPWNSIMNCCDNGSPQVKELYRQIAVWNTRTEATRHRSIREDAGLTDDISHYELEPVAGHRYVNAWDLGKKATRSGRNAAVGMVFDITFEPWTLVAYRYAEGMSYIEAKSEFERWHEKYGERADAICYTTFDSTGKGDVLKEYVEIEQTIDNLQDVVFSGANKPNIIHAGKICIEREITRFPFIRRLVDQLSSYVMEDKEIPQDTVMCYCLAMYRARMMTRMTDKEPLQARLNARTSTYEGRAPLYKRNPRYIESRMSRRHVRKRA